MVTARFTMIEPKKIKNLLAPGTLSLQRALFVISTKGRNLVSYDLKISQSKTPSK